MAEDLGKDGIRVNAISAGPIQDLAAVELGISHSYLSGIRTCTS